MINWPKLEFFDPLHGLTLPEGTPGQLQTQDSLGFGYFYYGLARLIKPKTVVSIGSKWGFAPALFALALKHSGQSGRVVFIDASFADERDGLNKGWGGAGAWHDIGLGPFQSLELNNVELIVNETQNVNWQEPIDILMLDGDHTYEGVKHDYEKFGAYASYIFFHDSSFEEDTTRVEYSGERLPPLKGERNQFRFGVRRFLREKNFPGVEIPIRSGLTLVDHRKIKWK